MFLSQEQIKNLGFKSIGKNVLISDKSSIYFPENIEIGDNTRIDDFCILSPSKSMKIGSHVHISCYTSLIGAGEFIIEDFVGISGKCSLYSSSDDFSGRSMTNPMIPNEFKKLRIGNIHIKKHTIIGAHSIVLPKVIIGIGCAVYAQSLIMLDCKDFGIYSGNPAKIVGERRRIFLDHEKSFLEKYKSCLL